MDLGLIAAILNLTNTRQFLTIGMEFANVKKQKNGHISEAKLT